MTNKPELIIELGAEGGNLKAYRRRDLNENYTFHFATSEMGLDFDEGGITTSSKELITDFDTLLEKMREAFKEIYNLFPLFVHPDYSRKVLYDLRFRLRNINFHTREWARVLFLKHNAFDNNSAYYDYDSAEAELIKTIEMLDLVDPNIKDVNAIFKEIERLKQLEIDTIAENTPAPTYDSYNFFAAMSTEELKNLYSVVVHSNPNGQSREREYLERILLERGMKI